MYTFHLYSTNRKTGYQNYSRVMAVLNFPIKILESLKQIRLSF